MKILDPDAEYNLPEPKTEIERLLLQLTKVSSLWYKTKMYIFVMEFHLIYDQLIDHGWDDSIDIEVELPDELMPDHYLNQLNS